MSELEQAMTVQDHDAAKAESRGVVGNHAETEGYEPMQQRRHHRIDDVPLGHLAQLANP
jgi:hypothetical protein